jgi:hypothetical protein
MNIKPLFAAAEREVEADNPQQQETPLGGPEIAINIFFARILWHRKLGTKMNRNVFVKVDLIRGCSFEK